MHCARVCDRVPPFVDDTTHNTLASTLSEENAGPDLLRLDEAAEAKVQSALRRRLAARAQREDHERDDKPDETHGDDLHRLDAGVFPRPAVGGAAGGSGGGAVGGGGGLVVWGAPRRGPAARAVARADAYARSRWWRSYRRRGCWPCCCC